MSRASFRSVALAISWRSIHNFLTNPAFLIPSLIFPLFFFSAFAGGLSSVSKVPDFNFPNGYTAFQFVFVVLQSAAFGGVFTGFGIARDFESGFGQRWLLSAPRRGAIVVGYMLAALFRSFVVWTLLTIIALIAGMKVGGSGVDLFGLYALGLIVNMAASLWATGVALRIRSIQGGPAMQIPVFLILFMAPVYVPLHLIKVWVNHAASYNPLTAIIEAGRGFLSAQPQTVGLAYLAALGLVALGLVWAVTGLRRAERGV